MRKVFGGAVVTFVMTSLFAVATATAASPHFIRANASVPPSVGQLVVDYKVAGLGNTVTTSVALRAERTATWACKDDDDNFPGDPLVAITPSAGTTLLGPFPATGGQVAGTISVSPGGHLLQPGWTGRDAGRAQLHTRANHSLERRHEVDSGYVLLGRRPRLAGLTRSQPSGYETRPAPMKSLARAVELDDPRSLSR